MIVDEQLAPALSVVSAPREVLAIQVAIDTYWQSLHRVNPNLSNGDIYSLLPPHLRQSVGPALVYKSTYAHFRYTAASEDIAPPAACHRVAANCTLYLVQEDAFVLGRMAGISDFRDQVKFIGGACTSEDVEGGFLMIGRGARREWREEFGSDALLDDARFCRNLRIYGETPGVVHLSVFAHQRLRYKDLDHYRFEIRSPDDRAEPILVRRGERELDFGPDYVAEALSHLEGHIHEWI